MKTNLILSFRKYIVLFLILTSTANANSLQNQFNSIQHDYKEGRFASVEVKIKDFIGLVQEKYGRKSIDVIKLYDLQGSVYQHLQKFDKAIASYKTAHKILTKSITKYPMTEQRIENGLAHSYVLKKSYKEALPILVSLKKKLLAGELRNVNSVWETLIDLATVQFELKNYEKAKVNFILGIKAIEETAGVRNEFLIGSLDMLAEIYYNEKVYDLALKYYKKSKEQIELFLGKNNENYAVSLAYISDCLIQQKKYLEASKYLEEGLEVYDRIKYQNQEHLSNYLWKLHKIYTKAKLFEKAELIDVRMQRSAEL